MDPSDLTDVVRNYAAQRGGVTIQFAPWKTDAVAAAASFGGSPSCHPREMFSIFNYTRVIGALLRFKRETGHDVSALNEGDVEELLTLLYLCVLSACKADGVEFGLTLGEFADSLDAQEMNPFYASMASGAEKKTVKKAAK